MFGAEAITDEIVRAACNGSQKDRDWVLKIMAGQIQVMIRARLAPTAAQIPVAEDLAQQALIDLSQSLASLREPTVAILKSCASTIVSRRVADFLRAPHAHEAATPARSLESSVQGYSHSVLFKDLLSASGISPASDAAHNEELGRILSELGRLKPHYRDVIVMAFFDQLPVQEIAQRLEMKRGAASMLLIRAMKTLRAAVANDTLAENKAHVRGSN